MGRIRTLAGLSVTVVALLALTLPGTASSTATTGAKRSCDSINLGVVRVLYKQNMRCSTAKKYSRRLYKSGGEKEPRGFDCTSQSDFIEGAVCQHNSKDKYFGWHSVD